MASIFWRRLGTVINSSFSVCAGYDVAAIVTESARSAGFRSLSMFAGCEAPSLLLRDARDSGTSCESGTWGLRQFCGDVESIVSPRVILVPTLRVGTQVRTLRVE